MVKVSYKKLLNYSYKVLKESNLNNFSAKTVSLGLCNASLRGVDSHGIKLLPHYVNSALLGRKNPNPKFKFYKKFRCVQLLDADNAFGLTAGCKAVDRCVDIAEKNGVGVVGVKNSSHPGAMASILLEYVKKGFLIFGFTHADSLQLTYGGTTPYFGTNPLCFAAPRGKAEPFCLDMATTKISWNKLLDYKRLKKKLPKGAAADKFGKMTTNPFKASSLLSIGDYKGFGLAAAIEILCSVFIGMKFGKNIPSMYKSSMKKPRKLGQLYIAIRSDSFISQKLFVNSLVKMCKEVRSSNSKNKIFMPNDKEICESKIRLKKGIPIDNELFKKLNKISNNYRVNI
jgi:LDH2 family malate/lactate/ureidoglycolate dehydrogenase